MLEGSCPITVIISHRPWEKYLAYVHYKGLIRKKKGFETLESIVYPFQDPLTSWTHGTHRRSQIYTLLSTCFFLILLILICFLMNIGIFGVFKVYDYFVYTDRLLIIIYKICSVSPHLAMYTRTDTKFRHYKNRTKHVRVATARLVSLQPCNSQWHISTLCKRYRSLSKQFSVFVHDILHQNNIGICI